MFPILIALLVFILFGLGLTAWLRRPPVASAAAEVQRRDASLLGQLRWRDFAKLVIQAMQGRGYKVVVEPGMPADGIPTDGGDILLERGGDRTLLSCKYGSGSIVGAQALLGGAKSAALRGAEKVLVVTPGRFDEEAERIAQQQNIELIDGADLWPEVRPYVARPEAAPAPAEPQAAPAPNPKAVQIAWGGAAVAGAIAWMLAQGMQPDPVAETAAEVAATQPTTTAPATEQAAIVPATPNAIPTDPAELERRRADAASAISTLFGVDRAIWSTQSTLLIYLSAEQADPSGELCPLLERYPELAASRLQLQPPQGSDKPVRFRQCRAY